jgi:hypothetical protein
VRLWKSNTNDLDEIKEVEKKWKNSSAVKIDAICLTSNLSDDEKRNRFVEDLPFADGEGEIIIVEVPNASGKFVLRPVSGDFEEAGVEKKPAPVTEPVLMQGEPVKLEDLMKREIKEVVPA